MTDPLPLSPSTLVRQAAGAMSAAVDNGESVLLRPGSNTFYGLDDIGSRIWELLAEARSVAQLCAALTAEYAVDAERCQADVEHLLGALLAVELIERVDG